MTLTAMVSLYRVRLTSSSFITVTFISCTLNVFPPFFSPLQPPSLLVLFQTPHVRREGRRMKGWIIISLQLTCLKRTFSIIGTVYEGVTLEVSFSMVFKIAPLVFFSLTVPLLFHESNVHHFHCHLIVIFCCLTHFPVCFCACFFLPLGL